MVIRFTVWADPVPQPRQRHRVVTTGGKTFVNNYTPAGHPVNAFKAAIIAAAQAYTGPVLTGPVYVALRFVFARVKSEANRKPHDKRRRHTKAKDRDNLEKACLDAITDAGNVWGDDRQVCAGPVEKWIGRRGELGHVDIFITEVNEWET